MSITASVPETPEQLTALLAHIQSGEEILLTKSGVAIARIIPTSQRISGQDKGKIIVAPDFNEPLPQDILDDFLNPKLLPST